MMLRLPKNAYPRDPSLHAPRTKPQRGSANAGMEAGILAPAPQEPNGVTTTNVVQVFPISK